ncbi:glycogen synthase [Cohnella faecalis]|uniref:Glycogen synthase n=1 Tax=Cohnella faecalis TaxID=2315694 RepID=A0A398CRZ4_9BACL|nr:glycogen/starch synthase [Cohnella faecalis]RIE03989.1 glycogen synthase [Cohnella faecalis]
MEKSVLFVTSQLYPYTTGTMGVFNFSLPKHLIGLGWDARVIVPRIPNPYKEYPADIRVAASLDIPMGERSYECDIEFGSYDGVPVYFVNAPAYFGRKELYGHEDEAERFGYFCKAVLEALPQAGFRPSILHIQDWHTGLIPFLLRTKYKEEPFYEGVKTLLTVHNLGYQGVFDKENASLLDVPWEKWVENGADYYDQISFMKAGLLHADSLTTVSPTYAKEIATEQYGSTLEATVQRRSNDLYGILCGLDTEINNPAADVRIHARYDENSPELKLANKRALQQALGFPQRDDVPIVSLFSRLKTEKGLDLVMSAFEDLMRLDLQFVIVSNGDAVYEEFFRRAAIRHPDRFAFVLYDNDFAYQAYAGADLFLMPSGYEPCGIGQLIALRYGAVPIVRQVGGLNDSIRPFDEATGAGNGFVFKPYHPRVMLYAIRKALEAYKRPDTWRTLVTNGMSENHGWPVYVKQYADVYERMLVG